MLIHSLLDMLVFYSYIFKQGAKVNLFYFKSNITTKVGTEADLLLFFLIKVNCESNFSY